MMHHYLGIGLLLCGISACSAGSNGDGVQAGGSGNQPGVGGAGAGGAGANDGSGGDLVFGGGNASGTAGSGANGGLMMRTIGDNSCSAIVNRGEQIPLDIYVMFDQSLSMTCAIPSGGDRWTAVKTALQSFVNAPEAAGIEVGIQYFGQGGFIFSSCTATDYVAPDVEIGPLPPNAPPIVASLNAHNPNTDTPTAAALNGAIQHASAWKTAHPGHTVIVVLVTDGQPNACGAIADVVTVATAGLAGSTIPTYVIGVISPGTSCGLDGNPPNQADLDTVAAAGGSQKALLVDVTQDPGKQFVAEMNQIRGQAQVPCQYEIPPPPAGMTFNSGQVNVQYTPPMGTTPTTVYGVDHATCDPTNGGWYYDNPGTPKTINLCPATCTQVTSKIGGTVDIALGCGTVRPPA